MVRTKNFEAAATCFRKAGNVSRAQACQAQAKLQAAAQVGVAPGACSWLLHLRGAWLSLLLLFGWPNLVLTKDLSLMDHCPSYPPATLAACLLQLDEEQLGQQAAEQQRALRFDAGYLLLGTALNVELGQEADAVECREWLLLAAAALKAAGEEAAVQEIGGLLGPGPAGRSVA
jgi:hypothetical protein